MTREGLAFRSPGGAQARMFPIISDLGQPPDSIARYSFLMETDSTKGQAGRALTCLNELRGIDSAKALPNLRLIREFFGMIQPDDLMERSEAWWELCHLCRALSSSSQDRAAPHWESTIGATEKWCTKLN